MLDMKRTVLCLWLGALGLIPSFAQTPTDTVRAVLIGMNDLDDPDVLFGACVFSELGFLEPDSERGMLRLCSDPPRRQLGESGIFRSVSDFQSRYYGG